VMEEEVKARRCDALWTWATLACHGHGHVRTQQTHSLHRCIAAAADSRQGHVSQTRVAETSAGSENTNTNPPVCIDHGPTPECRPRQDSRLRHGSPGAARQPTRL
jgi:hypothetical protein